MAGQKYNGSPPPQDDLEVYSPENPSPDKLDVVHRLKEKEAKENVSWWRPLKRLYAFMEQPEKLQKQTFEFMPAALEVQESPPSPIGRVIIWMVVTFFVLAVVWAIFGRVDIVAVAQGKVIPSGRVKTIQPLEFGSVAQIHIKEGQRVHAGDSLVTLDETLTAADSARLSQQRADLELDLHRHRIFQAFLERDLDLSATIGMYRESLEGSAALSKRAEGVLHRERLLVEEINEYLSRKRVLNSGLLRRAAQLEGVEASIVKSQKTLPIITERTEALRKLSNDKLVAKVQYLELEQKRISEEQDLLTLSARKREVQAAISEISSQQSGLLAESQKSILLEISNKEQKIKAIKQDLIKANQRNRMQILAAPISGTVQQLAVHTVGGVVTPAQQLMLIVPDQDKVEVEAFLLNKDVGFVREGQVAEVKIDTFNFTKYGTVDAEVVDISNDALQDENLGLVYLARVLLTKSDILVDGKWIKLSSGMAVTVEVKTGKRRIIEYFLSPLLRYKQESIRER